MKVNNIILIQTKKQLIDMLEKNILSLNDPADYLFKEVEAIRGIELPELEGNWEYSSKFNSEDTVQIIAHQVIWNEVKQLYDFSNEKTIMTISL